MKRLAVCVSMIAALVLPAAVLANGALPLGKYRANVKTPARLKGIWVLSFMQGGKYTALSMDETGIDDTVSQAAAQ